MMMDLTGKRVVVYLQEHPGTRRMKIVGLGAGNLDCSHGELDELRPNLPKLVDIRSGEYRKTVLMFLYIFLLLLSFVIIKAVRDALFLVRLGP